MCVFVLGALPIDCDVERVRAATRWRWEPLENASLARALGPRMSWYRVTGSWCDCHTPLGRGSKLRERRRRNLPPRSKTWSAARRARWHEQQRVNEERRASHDAEERELSLSEWRERLASAVGNAGEVALFVRMFHGAITDPLDASITPPVALAELTDELLLDLPDTSIQRIVARSKCR